MKPSNFIYHRPDDFGTALRLLSSEDDAKLIAGGQSLGPMMNFRVSRPKTLVDISRLPELAQIGADGDYIVVGSAVRHADFEDGRVPSPISDLFPRVALGIAYRAVRNRGTVGGSLAHSDPAADWPAIMLALDARINLNSVRGARTIKMNDLLVAPLETSLASDEAIETISIPRRSKNARFGRYKINRQPGEFAEAASIIVFDPEVKFTRAVLSGAKMLAREMPATGQAIGSLLAGKKGDLDAAIGADLSKEELSPYETRLFEACLLRAASEILRQ